MKERSSLWVAAGVVVNPLGEVLIAQRPEHQHLGGLWEFPGGKVEPQETIEQALFRELAEELAINVVAAEPLIQVRHAYPDRNVTLDVFRVTQFEGVPRGMLGQPLRWVRPESLKQYEFPAANRPIVIAAQLPDRYGIVDANDGGTDGALRQVKAFVAAGVTLIRLRAKMVDPSGYRELAAAALAECRVHGARLLLSGSSCSLVDELGADGIHIDARHLMELTERTWPADRLLAASCHNLAELQRAEANGVDFATLSPVLPTQTHPNTEAMGWAAFSAMVSQVSMPIYALGGMGPEHVPSAKRHGAQGIAGIRRLLGA